MKRGEEERTPPPSCIFPFCRDTPGIRSHVLSLTNFEFFRGDAHTYLASWCILPRRHSVICVWRMLVQYALM